ncbi:MAG: DNA helicase HerA-like ATPase [Crocinitomicaceae bacterium]|jgi:DNA helicase HerA-like ATPase
MKKESLELDTILKIGRVTGVKGRTIEVLVDKSKNSSHLVYKGEVIKNVAVGSYVKICKGFQQIVGKIDSEHVAQDMEVQKKTYKHKRDNIKRVLSLKLLGYFEKGVFRQGVKELPLIENDCFLLTTDEFSRVHNFIKEINGVLDEEIVIGRLSNDTEKEIKIGINSLFASHIGVFGNTGSGKSYTLACLYNKLFAKYQGKVGFEQNAKFLFFDFNSEYSGADCITSEKSVFNLSTRKSLEEIDESEKLPINEKTLVDVELISILANATDKTQKPFISRAINFYHKVDKADDPLDFFRNIVKRKVKDVLQMIDNEKSHALVDYLSLIVMEDSNEEPVLGTIEWNNSYHHWMPRNGMSRALTVAEMEATELYIQSERYDFPTDTLTKIIHFLYLQLIYDVFFDKAKNEHIGPAINKLKSKTKSLEKVLNTNNANGDIFEDSNIVVINLNDVNTEIKKTIPLLLSKRVYSDHKVEFKSNRNKYLNIIIDEAHNILSYDSERESETWKDYRLETFEEIIKEGRKFGVFLTVASQRPSDISSTIISQLHNYFLHRLINNRDIEAVERTVAYLDKVSFEALPIMPTGTCVLAGLSAHVPVMVDIDKIEDGFEPDNQTIRPTDSWEN